MKTLDKVAIVKAELPWKVAISNKFKKIVSKSPPFSVQRYLVDRGCCWPVDKIFVNHFRPAKWTKTTTRKFLESDPELQFRQSQQIFSFPKKEKIAAAFRSPKQREIEMKF